MLAVATIRGNYTGVSWWCGWDRGGLVSSCSGLCGTPWPQTGWSALRKWGKPRSCALGVLLGCATGDTSFDLTSPMTRSESSIPAGTTSGMLWMLGHVQEVSPGWAGIGRGQPPGKMGVECWWKGAGWGLHPLWDAGCNWEQEMGSHPPEAYKEKDVLCLVKGGTCL